MRKFIVAAAMAIGLVILWAAILPLTAQPAPPKAPATSPAMSKALFLCRTSNGIDKTCVAALAKALVLDEPAAPAARASEQSCTGKPELTARLDRHD